MKVTDGGTRGYVSEKKGKRRALAEIQNKQKASPVEKVEQDLKKDIKMEYEYSGIVLEQYRRDEGYFLPAPNYMRFQEQLRWAMRTVLVDWIIDVHCKLNLLPETLYLSVNLIDRFLSVRVVSIGKLQLVGVAGLLVASKFQEIASPSVETFVVLTDRSFTESEILRAEKYMLHCLEYRIGCPSPLNWMRRCSHNSEIERVGTVILDLLLLDERFLKYLPSVAGSAASYIARCVTKSEEYEIFHRFSAYSIAELRECIEEAAKYLKKPILHASIFKKHGVSFTKYLENLSMVNIADSGRT